MKRAHYVAVPDCVRSCLVILFICAMCVRIKQLTLVVAVVVVVAMIRSLIRCLL